MIIAIDKRKLMTEENMKKAFEQFDKDGDGNIDVNDLRHIFINRRMKKPLVEKKDT